ncbi:MAG: type II secretion system minor pseudopilin GspK [Burkholderiales bacterium]|nr:type II secretion system minor pseudopilin GspK [Burkholderiales bacterium]
MKASAPNRRVRARRQRGAALLLAMLILALVASAASAMVWQQQRAVELQAAERVRTQAEWILIGAQDWARLLLRQDANRAFPPSAGWARKLEESRLSQFLAADRDTQHLALPEVFLGGEIDDAQSRYNLRRLVGEDGKPVAAEVAALRRLCAAAGADAALADRLAERLASAWRSREPTAPLPPTRVEQLGWLGVDAALLAPILPYVTLLPAPTPLNANTAQAPALVAAVDGLELPDAQRIVQALQRSPAPSSGVLQEMLPSDLTADPLRVGVQSSHFEVRARLRWEDRVLEERWLFQRSGVGGGAQVRVLRSERSSVPQGGPA